MFKKLHKTKQRYKQTAVVLITASALVQPVHSSGIPTFDGAAAANAIQQLLNWKARFDSLVRDKLSQIPGVKQFLDARQAAQIENLFQSRISQCQRMRKSNATSADLCVNTVRLERKKYDLLQHMNTEITAEFNRINGRISSQGSLASSAGAANVLAGAGGNAGKAETAENDVQAQLQGLLAKIKHYETQLANLDTNINQLKWARKQLTKDQLSGNTGLSASISKGVATTALELKANKWRTDARYKRLDSAKISNRF
ncbi:hypothetical protein [Neisseria sp. CCUG12390]|uniref:hypothetical protein n=1 Tax=Neisseria sp. CCUG12390 TaxID=3392035 RepID=UPI003A0FBA35